MTEPQDKNDDHWLAALAGKHDSTSDIATNKQAEALRRALQEQSHRMDKVVPVADDIQYQRLLFRLRQESLTEVHSFWSGVLQWGRTKGQLAARVMTAQNTLAWALVATAILVMGVALQMNILRQGQDSSSMHDVFRSGGIVLIVSNPKARAEELQAGLKSAGTETTVITGPDGQFQLRFRSSTAALEYLNNQRIEPAEVEGFVTLTITTPAKLN